MIYKEYRPGKHLSKYIECYWSAFSDKPPFREREYLIPDRTIELIFNFGDPYSQVIGDKNIEIKGSHVIGIRKESLVISQTRKQDFFCIRFKLGGIYPFFKIPANLFANGFYTLDELFGKEFSFIEEKLYEIPDNRSRIVFIEDFLLKKLDDNLDEYMFVENCSSLLQSPRKIIDLAAELNTNYKALERKFKQVLGLTPEELLKINRFNSAVLAMYSCKFNSLTNIAHWCGYYDQSHFIREFRHLTGLSPKEFLKEQFTIVQIIQPALAERMSKSYNF